MADIELVIKIDEEEYNLVKRQVLDGITNPLKICIANGTPLPKRHGRLIDADEYKRNLKWNENIDNAPTIIEAYKGEQE